MYKIRKEFSIDYAHRLSTHEGQCQNIHGHTAKIFVEIERIDKLIDFETGMVMDFGRLKETAGEIINEYDHALILFTMDVVLEGIEGFDFRIIRLSKEPTAEVLAELLYHRISEAINNIYIDKFKVIAVEFFETPNNMARYEGK